ncbi:hypothetical protein Tco_1384855 [Tanacetum coccineum]
MNGRGTAYSSYEKTTVFKNSGVRVFKTNPLVCIVLYGADLDSRFLVRLRDPVVVSLYCGSGCRFNVEHWTRGYGVEREIGLCRVKDSSMMHVEMKPDDTAELLCLTIRNLPEVLGQHECSLISGSA